MRTRLALVSLAALAWADAACAQELPPAAALLAVPVPTDIEADTGQLGLGTQVTQAGNVHTIDGGTRAGQNLFHSFSRFDLGQGDFARWVHGAGDPAQIRNVVNRVTGGDASRIFGTIDATALPNADFFFINPAGIVFGEGAQVNVPGAAHFSTASGLRFADGAAFTVATPGGSTFSVASPAAFGFVGGEGDMVVENSGPLFAGATDISLSAANIAIRQAQIEGGSLALTAVGDNAAGVTLDGTTDGPASGHLGVTGLAAPEPEPDDPDAPSPEPVVADTRLTASGTGGVRIAAGSISIGRAEILAAGGEADRGGGISIRTPGDLLVSEGAALRTTTQGRQGGTIDIAAGAVDLDSGGSIRTGTSGTCGDCAATGRSGDIRIAAERIHIIGDDPFSTTTAVQTEAEGAASGGNIDVAAGELLLSNGGTISSGTDGSGAGGSIAIHASSSVTVAEGSIRSIASLESDGGNAGSIDVRAPMVELIDGAITSATFSTGAAGNIAVSGERILLDGFGASMDSSAGLFAIGAAGSLTLEATELISLSNEASLGSNSSGPSDGGVVRLRAPQVELAGGSAVNSFSFCIFDTCGRGGTIDIAADRLSVTGFSTISSATVGEGGAGAVLIRAGELLMDQGNINSLAQPNSFGPITGPAGSVRIIAGRLAMTGSRIVSDTFGTGDAGSVELQVGEAELVGSSISSRAACPDDGCGPLGAAGNVAISGDRLRLAADADGAASFISTATEGAGSAGNILVAVEDVVVGAGSGIVSSTSSEGDAGTIRIAGGMLLLDDGLASTSTTGAGAAGSILVEVADVELRDGGRIASDAGEGCEEAACASVGAAGDIRVAAHRLRLIDTSGIGLRTEISSTSFGAGDAGSVRLMVDQVDLDGPTQISSNTLNSGKGGQIGIEAGNVSLRNRARLSSSTMGSGAGGAIGIDARGTVLVEHQSSIEALSGDARTLNNPAVNIGAGGAISIAAAEIVVRNESLISVSTFTNGNAGSIRLRAGRIALDRNALITSASQGSGDGGSLTIRAGDLVAADGSGIDAMSLGFCLEGPCRLGDAGDIDIDVSRLLMTGSAGDFASRSSIASSTATSGAAGNIRIKAGEVALDFSEIASLTESTGRAGTIDLMVGQMRLANGSRVTTSSECETCGQSGQAGDIKIAATGAVTLETVSRITSSTAASGNAGSVAIAGDSLALRDGSAVFSETRGSGDAGSIGIQTNLFQLVGFENESGTNYSTVSSATFGTGDAGAVAIDSDRMEIEAGRIRSNTIGQGNAGTVTLTGGDIIITAASQILSDARPPTPGCAADCFQSNAGEIGIAATRSLSVSGESLIASSTGTRGGAGSVGITAPLLTMDGAVISSSSVEEGTGTTGIVAIEAGALDMTGRSSIETISNNSNPAGGILIDAGSLRLSGPLARISSSNEFSGAGDAGGIFISTGDLGLFDGAQLASSSVAGAAGTIEIFMPQTALLRLESAGPASTINTSSGPGLGGRIIIFSPRAIISNGGSILALGQEGGANVEIASQYFISSSDRTNRVAVDGNFLLEAAAYDVSAGTVNRDLAVIDASGVLRGQCAAARTTGQVSQLVVRPIGPYGSRPVTLRPPAGTIAGAALPGNSCS